MSDSKKLKNTQKEESRTPRSMDELLSLSDFQPKTFRKGDFVKGTIVEIKPKAVFIDIGGKTEGMVTGRELAAVRDFVSQLKVGDRVTAQIRVQEDDKGYALLSLRQAALDYSWKFFEEAAKRGEVVEVFGKDVNHGGVVVIAPFGLFGFIPGSQISRQYDGNPSLLIGKKVKVKVLEVDKRKNRLVFSERLVSEPDIVEKEREVIKKIKIGDKFKARVVRVEPFGLFVKVAYSKDVLLEGLVHISEISWEKVTDLTKMFKPGDETEVCLVNKENDKLQFSIKRLYPDPWENIEEKYPVDSEVEGVVTQTTPFGALVRLEPGIEGLIHISKIPPGVSIKEGEKVKCFVEHIDIENRKLSLELRFEKKPVGYK